MTDNEKRVAALAKLLARYHADPEDYDQDCEEDLRPYMSGEKPCERFVCITQHEEKPFFLPSFDDPFDAVSRSWEYATDDTFAESPLGVFDLDTEQLYIPDWPRIHMMAFVNSTSDTAGYRQAQEIAARPPWPFGEFS